MSSDRRRRERPSASRPEAAASSRPLKILSFNIVVGLRTSRPHHYVTQAWRHVLPSFGAHDTLDRIADFIRDYDVVAIQEADAGSLRTRFVNQVAYLAERAGFAYWETGVNRDLGVLAQHCLGVLSHVPLTATHRALPGLIPGRGLLDVTLGHVSGPLRLIVTHLSLTRSARARQLELIAEVIEDTARVVVVGDLNCDPHELRRNAALQRVDLRPQITAPTYPSWRPDRCFDQAMVRGPLRVAHAGVVHQQLSDHLPITLHLDLD
jgi:endonuclease/exonuclease/phosphatase family metal-dependent hydrolase